MKKIAQVLSAVLLFAAFSHYASAQSVEEVVSLVQQTRKDIEKNAIQTFSKINKGESPYRDSKNRALYVFVSDANFIVVAHGSLPERVGINMRSETDLNGKAYVFEEYEKAMKYGSGWMDYAYVNPKTKKASNKISYFEMVLGSNGKSYIVGSGLYYDK